jgi:hypothetical protein
MTQGLQPLWWDLPGPFGFPVRKQATEKHRPEHDLDIVRELG